MKRLLVLAVLLSSAACGVGTSGLTTGAPADHTVNQHGVMHRSGLTSPMTQCVACHGANLQGDDGPSCTSCHGQKW